MRYGADLVEGSRRAEAAAAPVTRSEKIDDADNRKGHRGCNHKNLRRVEASQNVEHRGTLTVPDTRA